jgi:hypothetical protein
MLLGFFDDVYVKSAWHTSIKTEAMARTEVDRSLRDASTVPLLRDSHERDELERRSKETPNSSFQARARLYWLAAVLCCGALLFGYDSGLIGTSDP